MFAFKTRIVFPWCLKKIFLPLQYIHIFRGIRSCDNIFHKISYRKNERMAKIMQTTSQCFQPPIIAIKFHKHQINVDYIKKCVTYTFDVTCMANERI